MSVPYGHGNRVAPCRAADCDLSLAILRNVQVMVTRDQHGVGTAHGINIHELTKRYSGAPILARDPTRHSDQLNARMNSPLISATVSGSSPGTAGGS